VVPRGESPRFLILLCCSAGLSLAINAVSPQGVALFAGPGNPSVILKAPRMSLDAFGALVKAGRSPALIDVRSDEAYSSGHPRGAFHAPASQFMDHYSRLGLGSVLKAAQGVVVLCDSDRCSSGDQVAEMLVALGHHPIFVLEGGWEKYRASDLEVVRQ
jgi:rhodanese-related sulfurtransferase